METWLMTFSEHVFDKCLASSRDEASNIFKNRHTYENWSEADIISEADFLVELELNAFENQATEY